MELLIVICARISHALATSINSKSFFISTSIKVYQTKVCNSTKLQYSAFLPNNSSWVPASSNCPSFMTGILSAFFNGRKVGAQWRLPCGLSTLTGAACICRKHYPMQRSCPRIKNLRISGIALGVNAAVVHPLNLLPRSPIGNPDLSVFVLYKFGGIWCIIGTLLKCTIICTFCTKFQYCDGSCPLNKIGSCVTMPIIFRSPRFWCNADPNPSINWTTTDIVKSRQRVNKSRFSSEPEAPTMAMVSFVYFKTNITDRRFILIWITKKNMIKFYLIFKVSTYFACGVSDIFNM